MSGPWDDYAPTKTDSAGPWSDYKPAETAKPAAAPKETPHDSMLTRIIQGGANAFPIVGALDAGLGAASGMLAKPTSEVMGGAAMAKDALTRTRPEDMRAEGFKNDIRDAMTYEPRSEQGKLISKYGPGALIGRGVDWAGSQLEAPPDASTGRRMLGAGLHEAVNQMPGLLGAKMPAAAGAIGDALKGSARDTMQSALKPTLADLKTGRAGKAIDTMLDEGINVSKGGLEKTREKVADLNAQIADKVENSKAIVNKKEVLKRLDGVFSDFEKQVNATDDIKAIQRAWQDFDKHPLIAGNKIPVPLAQELKQGTYRSLGNKAYGELKGSEIEAQKALARGLKEEIAKAVPEVHQLNAQESKLLNTLPMVERRVLMDANKNPIGLGWLTTNPAKFAGWMADRSPLFKSLVARMLNQGSKAAPEVGKLAPLGGLAVNAGAQQGQLQAPPQ